MFDDIIDLVKNLIKKIFNSRLAILGTFFCFLFLLLIVKLFNLQIVAGEEYLNEYVQMTEKTVTTSGTRGNIYDRNGYLLAYNEPAYSVTIQDTGEYPDSNSMNRMLYQLVQILNRHGYNVQGRLELGLDEEGNMIYTSISEAARKRFLRDYYGLRSVDELDAPKGGFSSSITPQALYQIRYERYQIGKMTDADGNPIIPTDAEALQIVDIRYTLSLSAYKKYESLTISPYIDEVTVADILEHSDTMKGVGIEETTIRRYNDAIYFAPIIGYTGKVQEDQLEELILINPEYELNDIVGRTGIEASMEAELQGGKGFRHLIVNNVGSVMEVVSETEPTTGNDIYLTIDRDLQIGIYHLLEQQLAGIIASKLVNEEVDPDDYSDTTKMPIPVKDAYFQLINNNVLSLPHMAGPEASVNEREIYETFSASRGQILSDLRSELMNENAADMKDLPRSMQAYMVYIYSYLSDPSVGIVKRDEIDPDSDVYQAWKDDSISLRNYLYAGISENWVDTSPLHVTTRYSSADDIYQVLVDTIIDELETDIRFAKRIFRYLINDSVISGRQLCLALFDQGILEYDPGQISLLEANGEEYAYLFMKNKITDIEITPAQLALDPCTAGATIVDVNTGEVRALVTYPSYDNNRLSGTVDAFYYNQLQEDLSLPLYNNATQAKKAPGSTFKPITAVAALEEHVIDPYGIINCTGLYDEITPAIRCWIYPGSHGELDIRGGILNSCNYFFAELAHRLCMDENGNYSAEKGIELIRKYASMFGLDRPSGIEITETLPEMTTEAPERSAMGQGTHAYANIQLARYVTALANQGTVFELSLLDKMTDYEGNLIEDFTPAVSGQIEIADSTWNTVREGMHAVILEGSAKEIFRDLQVDIAGKTGTAQESRNRANHAFFISYGPYTNPDISVTVNIPYGYSSSNAASIAKYIYRFYYGYTDLDTILSNGAIEVSNVTIGD